MQKPVLDVPEAPIAPEGTLEGEGPETPHILTRERLLSGAVEQMVRAAFGSRLLTDAERESSLRDTLAGRPDHGFGIWLFGYGSLIWNPTVHYVESRIASIEGWQRAFCLSTPAGRGTPEHPGLVLALDAGGSCTGVAFRIAEEVLVEELSIVWRREMLTGAYIPHWVPLRGRAGDIFGCGIAFTINRAGPQYADLPEAEVVRRLATAKGALGSASEYLFQTRDGLQILGIADPLIDDLALKVVEAKAKDEGF